FQKKVLVENGGLPDSKVVILPNFSDAPVLDNAPTPDLNAEFLWAGRLTPEKGVHTLLRALDALRGVPVTIAGDRPFAGTVERACQNAGHLFLGHIARAALRQRMERSRAFLFTSEWPEGCPSVILEAMSCGKPIIASSVPGAVQLLQEGRTGLFYPPG